MGIGSTHWFGCSLTTATLYEIGPIMSCWEENNNRVSSQWAAIRKKLSRTSWAFFGLLFSTYKNQVCFDVPSAPFGKIFANEDKNVLNRRPKRFRWCFYGNAKTLGCIAFDNLLLRKANGRKGRATKKREESCILWAFLKTRQEEPGTAFKAYVDTHTHTHNHVWRK